MCPHCGRIVAIIRGLTARHDNHNNSGFCKGSRQIARCAESDGRPLWNGKPNPHFYRAASSR